MSTVQAINNGASRCVELLDIVEDMFCLTIKNNVRLSALHIQEQLNILTDKLGWIFLMSFYGHYNNTL